MKTNQKPSFLLRAFAVILALEFAILLTAIKVSDLNNKTK